MSDHQQLYPFCRVTYWRDNTASSPDEAWTVCNVTPLGGQNYGGMPFENSNHGTAERDRLIRFLEKAYELGRSAAKREIREVLGIKETP